MKKYSNFEYNGVNMGFEKNGLLWADGDILKVKLPKKFLEEPTDEEELVFIAKIKWEDILQEKEFDSLPILPIIPRRKICACCGAKPKYKATDREIVTYYVYPYLCEKCIQEVSVTEDIESNPCFEKIPENELE